MKSKIIILLFSLATIQGLAQTTVEVDETTPSFWDNNFNLYMSPVHLLTNGVHLDVEYVPSENKKNAFLIGVSNYLGKIDPDCDYNYNSTIPSYCNESDQLKGFGVELSHKLFVSKDLKKNYRVYIQNRIGYEHLNFSFEDYGTETYYDEEFNVTATRNSLQDYELNISKMTYQFTFGQTLAFWEVVRFDWYLGFMLKMTNTSGSGEDKRTYNRNLLDYGYNGTTPAAGFRIGMAL